MLSSIAKELRCRATDWLVLVQLDFKSFIEWYLLVSNRRKYIYYGLDRLTFFPFTANCQQMCVCLSLCVCMCLCLGVFLYVYLCLCVFAFFTISQPTQEES